MGLALQPPGLQVNGVGGMEHLRMLVPSMIHSLVLKYRLIQSE